MIEARADLGRPRSGDDGCRRYLPVLYTFDSRNVILDTVVEEEWDPAVRDQWHANQAHVRMSLLAEHGTDAGERKIDDYRLLGPAPWLTWGEHGVLLGQVRSAFAHGEYYPALVAACSLGERVFNQVVSATASDYRDHKATTNRVRKGSDLRNWDAAIDVLAGWGLLDSETDAKFRELGRLRHRAVHYVPDLDVGHRRPALDAVHLVQDVLAFLLPPLGGPPRFIDGTPGSSYVALGAETDPIVRALYLPTCALVSPAHRLEPSGGPDGLFVVVDQADYDPSPLTDVQFADALPAGSAAMNPAPRSRNN